MYKLICFCDIKYYVALHRVRLFMCEKSIVTNVYYALLCIKVSIGIKTLLAHLWSGFVGQYCSIIHCETLCKERRYRTCNTIWVLCDIHVHHIFKVFCVIVNEKSPFDNSSM